MKKRTGLFSVAIFFLALGLTLAPLPLSVSAGALIPIPSVNLDRTTAFNETAYFDQAYSNIIWRFYGPSIRHLNRFAAHDATSVPVVLEVHDLPGPDFSAYRILLRDNRGRQHILPGTPSPNGADGSRFTGVLDVTDITSVGYYLLRGDVVVAKAQPFSLFEVNAAPLPILRVMDEAGAPIPGLGPLDSVFLHRHANSALRLNMERHDRASTYLIRIRGAGADRSVRFSGGSWTTWGIGAVASVTPPTVQLAQFLTTLPVEVQSLDITLTREGSSQVLDFVRVTVLSPPSRTVGGYRIAASVITPDPFNPRASDFFPLQFLLRYHHGTLWFQGTPRPLTGVTLELWQKEGHMFERGSYHLSQSWILADLPSSLINDAGFLGPNVYRFTLNVAAGAFHVPTIYSLRWVLRDASGNIHNTFSFLNTRDFSLTSPAPPGSPVPPGGTAPPPAAGSGLFGGLSLAGLPESLRTALTFITSNPAYLLVGLGFLFVLFRR